jgi:hypothetical protein
LIGDGNPREQTDDADNDEQRITALRAHWPPTFCAPADQFTV